MTVCQLHHEVDGPQDAPALLMGGSLGSTIAMWDPQVSALRRHTRLVRFDHRGHGGSPVPSGPYTLAQLGRDVLALLDRLDIGTASFCGLSLGGMVGMWLAAHAPERIERLILICTSAQIPTTAGYAARAATVKEAGTVAVVADAVLERWFTPRYAREHPDLVARYRDMLAATPAEGYAGCCEAIDGLDLRVDLPHVTAPTVVIAGAEDPATPPDRGKAIADAIAGTRLHILDDAAHLANVEQADAVTQLICDHLNSGRQP